MIGHIGSWDDNPANATPTIIREEITGMRYVDSALWVCYAQTGWKRAEDVIPKDHPNWLIYAKGRGNA